VLRILSLRRVSEVDKPLPLVRRLLKRVSRFTVLLVAQSTPSMNS